MSRCAGKDKARPKAPSRGEHPRGSDVDNTNVHRSMLAVVILLDVLNVSTKRGGGQMM